MSDITQETIKKVQQRLKSLQNDRDRILRQQAVQEQKRDEAYKNLRQLGITNPESMTSKELQALAESKNKELEEKIKEIELQLEQGEALITKFNSITEF